MRALLALTVLVAAAPAVDAVALLESSPGRALVQVDGDALVHGDGEARVAPAGVPMGAWARADALPLGRGSCERGLCGLVVVEVRGGDAVVVEGTSGVLVKAVPGEIAPAAEPAGPAFIPVPGPERAVPAGPLAALAAFALAACRR